MSRRRAIKRIFVTTNLERLRLGTSFLFREIARIGKTRAGKKEEVKRTTEGRTKRRREVRERERETKKILEVSPMRREEMLREKIMFFDHVF